MTTRSRLIAAALAVLVLAGCQGIPTTGPVRAGDGGVATPEPVLPILQGPQTGDSQLSIMQGFLTASAGGAVTGFDIAREFLSGDAAINWEPLEKVTVFDSRQATLTPDEETGVVTYSVPVAAVVDESGIMTESAPDVRQVIEFTVTKDANGEYRIMGLDNGIIISDANFVRYFKPVELTFATTDLGMSTPEVRWFANNDQIATVAARELIAGPSAWLADAVVTGFPATSSLSVEAVVVADGVAHVALAAGSAGSAEERALAAEQMAKTLTQLPSVSSVETTVGGVALTALDQAQLNPAPIPDEAAAVVAAGRFGLWDGTALSVTNEDAGAMPADARHLAMAYDGAHAAFVTSEGVWLTDAPSTRADFVAYDPAAPVPAGVIDADLVVPGTGLVGPSFDRFGWLWTTAQASTGSVVAFAPDADAGSGVAISAPWLAGRSVQAISVSRDGTRMVVLSRAANQQIVEVAAIVRDASGVPISLGEPLAVAPSVRQSIDVVWSNTASFMSLGEEAGQVMQATVGGRTVEVSSLSGAVAFSVRFGDRTLVAVTDTGELHVRSSNSWAPREQGVTDIAFSG
jgi:hypothetical protein